VGTISASGSRQLLDSSRDVFDRHVRIDAVLVEKVDCVDPEPIQ
jgi:hypothetical protein